MPSSSPDAPHTDPVDSGFADYHADYDDARVRDRIGPWRPDGLADLDAFDPDTNFVVRAAAGSGKTTALVARMVALVRRGVDPADLTAITFTRKAAGEMSTRFFQELDAARRRLPEGSAQRGRVRRALGNVQSTFIGTIHAFCSRILRERPLAAGLPPDFAAGLEAREERELRERAWRAHLQERHDSTEGRRRMEQLRDHGVDPQDLGPYFDTLCTHAELTPTVDAPEALPDLRPAVDAALEKVEAWNERRPDVLPKGRDKVMAAFDRIQRMAALRDLDAPGEQAELLQVLTGVSDAEKAKVKVTYWKGETVDNKDWAKALRDDLLPSFVASTVKPVLREWEAWVHRAAVRFAEPAVERYRRLRREEGLLTYHDLLAFTRDLLRDAPAVRREVQARYPRLLVDEFQDTDPVQAEILAYLSSRDPEETDWTACRPRDGSLFIVGDDKQSIYRFRRADKDVFDAVRRRVDDAANGEAVDLTKNFRSRAPICRFCNDAFASLFGAEKHRDIQADYVPFDPQQPDGPEGTALRRKPVPDVKGNWGSDIAAADAGQIARFIQAACRGAAADDLHGSEPGAVFPNGPADPSDFLVLTWRKKRLGMYAEALAAHGIPYTVTGSEDLGDSRELKALVDVLRAARRPDDPIAVVAYLKGDLAGFSDDALYRMRTAGVRFDEAADPLPDDALDKLDDPLADRLAAAWQRLRGVRRVVAEQRPGAGVHRLVDALGLLAGAAHPEDPAEASLRAGAVLRITSYVQHLAAEGLGWGEVTDELDRVLQGEEDLDSMTLETGGKDAVRLMNVHQAKGLEAPVVFLADPYTRGGDPPTTLHLRRAEGEIVAPIVQGEAPYQRVTHAPRGWHDDTDAAYKAEEERQEAAEDHRLLYVAATRAERMLVVSTYPKKPNDGYWSALYPHLDEAGVSELAVPEDEEAGTRPDRPAPDLRAGRRRRREQQELGTRPTYRTESVTQALAERSGAKGPTGESGAPANGYGRSFGTAMHRLFEMLIRHRADPPAVTAERLRPFLEGEGAEAAPDQVRAALSMAEGLRQSRLWEEVEAAREVRTEVAFARLVAGRGQGESAEGGADGREHVRNGTVDLAYRRPGGWVVVDFKTDRFDEADAALGADHPYRRQVRAYAQAWAALTGEPVAQAGLWLADPRRFVPVGEIGQRAQ